MIKDKSTTKGYPRLNLYLSPEYRTKLDQWARLLDAAGVDVRDPKRPGSLSSAAVIRWLIDNATPPKIGG